MQYHRIRQQAEAAIESRSSIASSRYHSYTDPAGRSGISTSTEAQTMALGIILAKLKSPQAAPTTDEAGFEYMMPPDITVAAAVTPSGDNE
jgi:hypothetical protein